MTNDRKMVRAVGLGIGLGFMLLAIAAALFEVVEDDVAAIVVALCAMAMAALGLLTGGSGR